MLRILALVGIGALALLLRGSRRRSFGAGHVPVDLLGDTHPDEHHRPYPHAEVAPEDREGLRPVRIPL